MRNNKAVTAASAIQQYKVHNYYPVPEQENDVPAKSVPDWVPRAVYPLITQECFARTMQNYRVFIAEYNKSVEEYNDAVAWHNAGVELHAEYEGHTELERGFQDLYYRRYKKLKEDGELNIREFNDEIDRVCLQHGQHVLKKYPLPKVKYATELVFQNFLHLYNTQLAKKNGNALKMTIRHKDPLRPLEINSHFVTKLMREGVLSINVCARTVRNHRIRLEEAGVLMGGRFRGRQRGVHAYFNPQILVILDAFSGAEALAENQSPTDETGKIFPDTNEITRPNSRVLLDKRDEAAPSSGNKEFAARTPLGYKTILPDHQVQGQTNSPGGAAESVKVQLSTSQILLKSLLTIPQLDEGLRSGSFDNYLPLDLAVLRPERNVSLTDEEYQQIIIQDLFKTFAKLYRGRHDILPGVWANAYKHWLERRFRMSKVWSKEKIFQEIEQYRYRISSAHRWFLSRQMQPLFPSKYLDVTRTGKDEFGFEYTQKFWLEHREREKDRPKRLAKEAGIAEQRKKEKLQARRYRYKINAFLNGKCDIDQLVSYVKKNLPAPFFEELGHFIQKHVADENHRSQYTA